MFLVSSLSANDKELQEKELHMLELQEVYETCLLKMKVCVKLMCRICSVIGMSRISTKHYHSNVRYVPKPHNMYEIIITTGLCDKGQG